MADESFKEFVLDQLRAVPDVRAKAMFGAHGLYQDEHFFGILDEGRLFFKTDASEQRLKPQVGSPPANRQCRDSGAPGVAALGLPPSLAATA